MEEDREAKVRSHRRRRSRDEQKKGGLYWQIDTVTEYLLYAILLFTPWAFGTTEGWAISTVNTLNYILGGLLVLKLAMRTVGGVEVARWEEPGPIGWNSRWITGTLLGLTVLALGYCALHAFNARAEFVREEQRFEYFANSKAGLPQSYHQSASWAAFQLYLAAACFFWALRDWLVTKTPAEQGSHEGVPFIGPESASSKAHRQPAHFPNRLRRLCWVLTINAALLAFEGTIQRLSGTRELLWMVLPRFNDTAAAQFGPFNYRSNGAQYLNLIWPLTLAFWWTLHHHSRRKIGEGAEFVLLPATALIIAGPIISSSRGGIAVSIAQTIATMLIFAYAFRRAAWKIAIAATVFAVVVGMAVWLQWDFLVKRFNENTLNTMSGRTEIYQNAEKILNDFPVWGTGPGTFPAMYQLYREDPEQLWYVHAHNDYLQTLATFGRVGFSVLGAMLGVVALHWFVARGVPASVYFAAFLWVGLAGCLLHARFDFPLQIYAILLIFLTNCAILSVLSRR